MDFCCKTLQLKFYIFLQNPQRKCHLIVGITSFNKHYYIHFFTTPFSLVPTFLWAFSTTHYAFFHIPHNTCFCKHFHMVQVFQCCEVCKLLFLCLGILEILMSKHIWCSQRSTCAHEWVFIHIS